MANECYSGLQGRVHGSSGLTVLHNHCREMSINKLLEYVIVGFYDVNGVPSSFLPLLVNLLTYPLYFPL